MPETEKIVRSRRKGLRDLYIAKLTQNDEAAYAAATPVKLARAISAKVSDKYTSEKIYSDDGVEEEVSSYEGTDIEFEVNSLAPQDRALLFGHLYENGFLVKNKNDKAPEVALGYRSKKMDGTYEFSWYYCGRFGQGNEDSYETESGSVKTQTNSLKGSFCGRRKDGNIALTVDEANLIAEHTDARAALGNWFAAVQEKNAAAAARN